MQNTEYKVSEMRSRSGQPRRSGFTLVEMLLVIGLIGMLASILMVALMTARRASIRLECQSKLNQLGQIVQQLTLDGAGTYPMLEQTPVNGTYPGLTPPISYPQANATTWWERVYQQTQGASAVNEQLPPTMQMFHCRMAPALDNAGADAAGRIASLSGTISYGLNFDMKRVDGKPYKWDAGTNDFLVSATEGVFGPRAGQAADKNPDQFNVSQIAQPGEFILLAESNAGDIDVDGDGTKDKTGYRIAAKKVSDAGASNFLHPAPIVARHSGQANILFADQHVELRKVEGPGSTDPGDANLDTRLWTLPAD